MEKESLVLTFDVGTQSMRAMLVSKKGEIVKIERQVYKQAYYSRNHDWAEQRVDYYFEVLMELSKKIFADFDESLFQIKAVTITTFRDSIVCLDKNNQPLNDLILWLDKREVDEKELPKIPLLKRIIFKITNTSDITSTQHKQSACNYLMVKEKEIWEKTSKVVLLPTYLIYKLTGNLVDTVSDQVGHLPFDYKKRCWMKEKGLTRCLFDVELDKLCDLKKPGEILGYIDENCHKLTSIPLNVPVIGTGTDKACEAIGLSVIGKNKAAVSYGTSATVQLVSPYYFEPEPFCPSYPSPIDGYYNSELQIYRGYWMLSWFKKEFAQADVLEAEKLNIKTEKLLDSHLKDVPIGCDGLILQPFWSPGVDNPNAKGAVVGFGDFHTKYHFYRAIIEGINFELIRGLKDMERRGKHQVTEVYVAGGGSLSDEICQIGADMFGLPFKRIQTHEATGVGSSMVAFVALKEFKDFEEASKNMVRVSDVFYPNKDNHQKYQKIYNDIYKHLYKSLLPTYKNIRKIFFS